MRCSAFYACLSLALTLTACGGSLVPGDNSPVTPSPTARPTSLPSLSAEPTCPRPMIRFIDALRELDSRLGVGLNFSAYSDKVGNAKVAYDRIPFKKLDLDCITKVGVSAEKALNLYVDAYNIWNDCIGDIYCSNDSITPKLQRKWAQATAKIQQARNGLH